VGTGNVLRLQLVYGRGIENYFNDAPVDVGVKNNPGNAVTPIVGEALKDLGIVLYLDHNWNSTWSTAAGYALVDISNSNAQAANAYRKGQYASVNLLSTPAKNVLASHPKAVMLLAPRHPERFDKVAGLLQQLGTKYWRRSQWRGEPVSGGVLLLDSIGELASAYSLADVAFVGGSLVNYGGHNILEPALFGVATVVGTSYQNFRDIVALFQQNQAVRIVGAAELPLVFMELVNSPEQRRELGRRALQTLKEQMGATQRTLEALTELMTSGEPGTN
jgi:hypothetical protein